jgi:hypothetical protein
MATANGTTMTAPAMAVATMMGIAVMTTTMMVKLRQRR